MSKQVAVQLLIKVPGYAAKEVYTSFPVTLYEKDTNKMVGYTNTKETQLISEHSKARVVQAWNGWSMNEYDVVWSGDSQKGLNKSSLKNQKGLLMPDVNMGSATKQIMDHMMLADIDDESGYSQMPAVPKGKKKKKV